MFFQIWVEFQRDERKIILKPSSDIQEGPNFFFFFCVLRDRSWYIVTGRRETSLEYLLPKSAVNKTKYT